MSLGISQQREHWRKVILRNLFFTGCSKFKFSHRIGLLFLPLFQWLWETVRDLEMGPPTLLTVYLIFLILWHQMAYIAELYMFINQ